MDVNANVVTGPTTLAAGAAGTYELAGRDEASDHVWRVEGDGVIEGSIVDPTVKVRASQGGGEFKVSCAYRKHFNTVYRDHSEIGYVTKYAAPLEVAVSEPLRRFRVKLHTPNNLSPATLTGSGTITMIDNAGAASWSLYFVGDTSHLLKNVMVRVRTINGPNSLQNNWLTATGETRHLFFPRSGGGSVGAGGSVLNTGARPDLRVGVPGETALVYLSAKGVETMRIRVKYRP